MKIKQVFLNLFYLFYPKICVGCFSALNAQEEFLCLECLSTLPKTNYHLVKENPVHKQLAGKFPLTKATSYLYYNKDGLGERLTASLKYRGNIYAGKWIARYLATDLKKFDFFDSVDMIISVPLHPKKYKLRGFNQSEIIAEGISEITKIPIETNILYREKANISQTTKNAYERWLNTTNIFDIKNPEMLKGKHILLIDDVLTTGATIEACARALLKSEIGKISLLTLAIAKVI